MEGAFLEKAHKKLKVWQEAITLVRIVYEATSYLPLLDPSRLSNMMNQLNQVDGLLSGLIRFKKES